MRFKIDNKIFEKFPNLNVGVLVCKKINNEGLSEEVIKVIGEREKEIQPQFNPETLSQNPKINVWREAYRAFGAKPKENKSSVEALYRRVLKGEELRHINKYLSQI